jgi:hypothetical protein
LEFTDWMLWKGIAIVAAACVYGFWKGITGRD